MTVAKADELLHIVRRRWLSVISVIIAVGAASFQYSNSQAPTYSASADVLLSRQNLAASLNNITDPGLASSDSNRIAQTQANLATAPAVIQLALQSVGSLHLRPVSWLETPRSRPSPLRTF